MAAAASEGRAFYPDSEVGAARPLGPVRPAPVVGRDAALARLRRGCGVRSGSFGTPTGWRPVPAEDGGSAQMRPAPVEGADEIADLFNSGGRILKMFRLHTPDSSTAAGSAASKPAGEMRAHCFRFRSCFDMR